jgi:hypothetical protein
MPIGVYKRKIIPVIYRIISKIQEVEGQLPTKCWNFIGATKNNYGMVGGAGGRKGGTLLVSRYMYWYYHKSYNTTWEEFCINCSNLCVCHKCDNPSCCNPTHLFLGTQKDNMQDCKNKGRLAIGEKQSSSKLNKDKILLITKLLKNGIFQREIAFKFGISQQQVSIIKNKQQWKHILNAR